MDCAAAPVMLKDQAEFDARGEELYAAVEKLEAQAGLTTTMRNIIDEGQPDPAAAGEVPFDSVQYYGTGGYDYYRYWTRLIYFRVVDVELRKKLISARNEFYKHRNKMNQRDVDSARDILFATRRRLHKEPWVSCAVGAIVVVVIGNAVYGVVGAVAAGAAWVFVGLEHLRDFRCRWTDREAEAQRQLDEVTAIYNRSRAFPHLFQDREAETGEENKRFSTELAWKRLAEYDAAQSK